MTGLQKQTITINFGNGVDNKTDPKLVQAGKLAVLENGVFNKYGRIDKRNGYNLLSSKTLAGATLTGGTSLAIFKNELLQYHKQKLYSFSEGSQRWIDKGPTVPTVVTTKQVINNTYAQLQCDSAVNDGVGVYAWVDSRGGVRASLYDETTGTTLLDDVSLHATATAVRCFSFSGYLYVFYYNAGSLFVRRVAPNNPVAFDAAYTISTNVNLANPLFDVASVNAIRMILVYPKQSSSGIEASFLNEDPTLLSGALAPATLTSEGAVNCLAIVPAGKSTFFVAYHNGANGLRYIVINNGGGVLLAPTTVDPTLSPVVVNVTGYLQPGASTVQLFYEISAANPYQRFVKKNTVSQAGLVGSPSILLRAVGLYSRAFSYASQLFVGLVHDSSLQATYFIARDDGVICAKMQPNLSGGLSTVLQNVTTVNESTFAFSLLNKTRLISDNSTLFSQLGVARTQIDFNNFNIFNTIELGQNLHIAGGVLQIYDGVSVVEHGFHLYPENVLGVQSSAGTGSLPAGTYQYAVTYEWKDNYGNIHKSAPSIPISVLISTTLSNATLTIPTLTLTAKKNNRTNVIIQVYRTAANGTIFYRTSSITSPIFNDPTIDFVTFIDSRVDLSLTSNDLLYTTGGDLDNAAAPSCSFMSVFKNRIFLGGLEDSNLIWYSKNNSPGQPVEFAAEQILNVDPQGGGLTALATLDDKQILFKRDRFYITYGDGPNNTGQLGEFAPPQFITGDAGCVSARSIVRVPQGLMFKSEKGIYTLNSSLQVDYTGAPVEDFNSLMTVSATLKSDVNQVRFINSNGNALVYDYYFKQWSTFTNHQGAASLVWNNNFILLRTDGNVYIETPGVFKDADTSYSLKLITAWLTMDSVTGFQRVYDVQFLGEYKSAHLLRCFVGYDFNPAYQSTILFNPVTSLPITYYGDDPAYGSISPYGGDNNAYRWKASLTQQKCQVIRFSFEDLVTASTAGTQESFTITSIGIQVGIKGHLGRMKDSLSIGTQGAS